VTEYVLENELAVEQRVNNELRARRHAIAAFRGLDMLMNGLVADTEQLSGIVSDFPRAASTMQSSCGAQMRDAWCLASCDSSRSVQCKPARRLKAKQPHIAQQGERLSIRSFRRSRQNCMNPRILREMNGDRKSFASRRDAIP